MSEVISQRLQNNPSKFVFRDVFKVTISFTEHISVTRFLHAPISPNEVIRLLVQSNTFNPVRVETSNAVYLLECLPFVVEKYTMSPLLFPVEVDDHACIFLLADVFPASPLLAPNRESIP